jgi:hypothetical protein
VVKILSGTYGRGIRTIGAWEYFNEYGPYKSKIKAQKKAKNVRKKGRLATTIKLKDGWCVYIGPESDAFLKHP